MPFTPSLPQLLDRIRDHHLDLSTEAINDESLIFETRGHITIIYFTVSTYGFSADMHRYYQFAFYGLDFKPIWKNSNVIDIDKNYSIDQTIEQCKNHFQKYINHLENI